MHTSSIYALFLSVAIISSGRPTSAQPTAQPQGISSGLGSGQASTRNPTTPNTIPFTGSSTPSQPSLGGIVIPSPGQEASNASVSLESNFTPPNVLGSNPLGTKVSSSFEASMGGSPAPLAPLGYSNVGPVGSTPYVPAVEPIVGGSNNIVTGSALSSSSSPSLNAKSNTATAGSTRQCEQYLNANTIHASELSASDDFIRISRRL